MGVTIDDELGVSRRESSIYLPLESEENASEDRSNTSVSNSFSNAEAQDDD